MMWEIIIAAVILLVVALIVILMSKNLLGKQQGTIENQITATGDYDRDLVPDAIDRCCTQGSEVDASGCPKENRNPVSCDEARAKNLATN